MKSLVLLGLSVLFTKAVSSQELLCCDPLTKPDGTNGNLLCFEGFGCCPNTGTWACGDGGGGIPCGELLLQRGDEQGPVCGQEDVPPPCCDPLTRPDGNNGNPMCIEGSVCCPNTGTWTCGDGGGGFPCGNLTLNQGDEQGLICSIEEPTVQPACCDPLTKPDGSNGGPICTDGSACCPNSGNWTCGDGGGSFPCGDLTLNPGDKQGPTCSDEEPPSSLCCDKESFPYCFIGTAACCPGGEWSCPNGNSENYRCNDKVVKNPNGTVCGDESQPPVKTCCDPLLEPGVNGFPKPREGAACCPDGSWGYNIGDGKTFACGGELIKNPKGEICPGPTCCDPNIIPECTDGESAKCCPQGIWTCSMGGNFYFCGQNVGAVEDPSGPICEAPCCDPAEEPGTNGNPFCTDSYVCCPDGTWSCSIGDGTTYPCGDGKATSDGTVCEKCCPPEAFPFCLLGTAKCCPEGNWICPNGDVYTCSNGELTEPEGKVCNPSLQKPWTYSEPIWWNAVKDTVKKLSKCETREFPPADGEKCTKRNRTCLFDTQDCSGTPYPKTMCTCDPKTKKGKVGRANRGRKAGGGWACESMACPAT